MTYTLFISDLHLSPTRQDLVTGFVDFCKSDTAKLAEAIYILGDFVEYWIGDDTPTTGLRQAFESLKQLSKSGVELYFQHGNRDFLIGSTFASRYGIKLLREHEVIALYGIQTLLLHGDTLCTDDVDYQNFRAMVRSSDWQKEILSKTLYQRIQYATSLRKKTKEATKEKAPGIMDVNQKTVNNFFKKYQVQHMIHGHTHRPAEHTHEHDHNKLSRVVLSDWGTKGQYFKVSDDRSTEFLYFEISDNAITKIKSAAVKVSLLLTLIRLYCSK